MVKCGDVDKLEKNPFLAPFLPLSLFTKLMFLKVNLTLLNLTFVDMTIGYQKRCHDDEEEEERSAWQQTAPKTELGRERYDIAKLEHESSTCPTQVRVRTEGRIMPKSPQKVWSEVRPSSDMTRTWSTLHIHIGRPYKEGRRRHGLAKARKFYNT